MTCISTSEVEKAIANFRRLPSPVRMMPMAIESASTSRPTATAMPRILSSAAIVTRARVPNRSCIVLAVVFQALRKLKMGVVGLGQGAAQVLPTLYSLPETQLVAGADPNERMRAGLLERFPGTPAYD